MSCTFDSDSYLDQQLHKYLDGTDYETSACCQAFFIEETDMCSECFEHSLSVADEKFNYMSDKADDERNER